MILDIFRTFPIILSKNLEKKIFHPKIDKGPPFVFLKNSNFDPYLQNLKSDPQN